MLHSRTQLVLLAACAAGVIFLAPAGQVLSDTIREVFVTNFPEIQRVEGAVSIKGAVRLSELKSFTNVIVPPVKPSETTRLVEAGTLVTDGFANVVLSLHGQVKGSVVKRGGVGAILIPVQETIEQAFNEQGLMHFSMEVSAPGVSAETSFFASDQPRHKIGFDAYRVLLYNTTDKTVTVNLFTYLTS